MQSLEMVSYQEISIVYKVCQDKNALDYHVTKYVRSHTTNKVQ